MYRVHWISLLLLFFLLVALGVKSRAAEDVDLSPVDSLVGEVFVSVKGKALDNTSWRIPEDMSGAYTLLLVGYKQDSQFDIDRWMIGVDQLNLRLNLFEIPTIKGFWPGLFKQKIDQGMRSGIEEPLWKSVITVYKDADTLIDFLGNERPLNARAVLLNPKGVVGYFHDDGFSVDALNALTAALPSAAKPQDLCSTQGENQ